MSARKRDTEPSFKSKVLTKGRTLCGVFVFHKIWGMN